MSQFIETQVARFQKWGFWRCHWLCLLASILNLVWLLEDEIGESRFWVDLISGLVFLVASGFWWFKIRLLRRAITLNNEKEGAGARDS